MTAKQKEILDHVFDLMGEHFDAFAVVYDIADIDDKGTHATGGQFHGGEATAVGMLRCYVARIESAYFQPIREEV